jgi:uncharacterized protein YndB with AHSA1/START domain
MIDMLHEIQAIHREVARGPAPSGELVTVRVSREYEATAEDVWDAVTDPERIRRWFLPLSGDLRVGGKYQLEGNAGGEILECDAPRHLRVTFGGPASLVALTLTGAGDDRTTLLLEHSVPIEMAGSGAGALFVGPGWDGSFLGLGLYLTGQAPADPVAAAGSPETIAFSKESVQAWAAAIEASGTATADEIAGGVAASMAHFAPPE